MLARFMFAIVSFAARKGLGATPSAHSPSGGAPDSAKHRARQTGVRGKTYAYWYLRRHGRVLVARNFTSPGIKGEIAMVGYDGATLAFVEVKTRTIVSARAAHSGGSGELGGTQKPFAHGRPVPSRAPY